MAAGPFPLPSTPWHVEQRVLKMSTACASAPVAAEAPPPAAAVLAAVAVAVGAGAAGRGRLSASWDLEQARRERSSGARRSAVREMEIMAGTMGPLPRRFNWRLGGGRINM